MIPQPHLIQHELFSVAELGGDVREPISGLLYNKDFIGEQESADLMSWIDSLLLTNAKYRQYTVRRRTASFGAGYDFQRLIATPAPAFPTEINWLRQRASHWAAVNEDAFVQALVSEYQPGTPLGWHRDGPDYELIFGVSLGNATRLRLRPYPWSPAKRRDVFSFEVAPRSAYILRADARWHWQHSVPPVKQLRYSITLRTRRSSQPAQCCDRLLTPISSRN